jgi:sulfur-oxidizing protein SoxX
MPKMSYKTRWQFAGSGADLNNAARNTRRRMMTRSKLLAVTAACACLPIAVLAADPPTEAYQSWTVTKHAIDAPLGGLKGDAARGRKLAIDSAKGNCLACHRLPIPEEEFHGEVGPDLNGLANRLSEEKIRLRIVDIQELNPFSLMPPMYLNPANLNQVAKKFQGQTILTAQEVEDVVAYLMTLK